MEDFYLHNLHGQFEIYCSPIEARIYNTRSEKKEENYFLNEELESLQVEERTKLGIEFFCKT